jgi:succinate dehydrogenase/fumarate reductase flavoprotein subunit
VFGARAGASATAAKPVSRWRDGAAAEAVDRIRALADGRRGDEGATVLLDALRALMGEAVGPLRDAAGLSRALARLGEIRATGSSCGPALSRPKR